MEEKKLNRFGIVAKPQSPLAPEAISRIISWGREKGADIYMDRTSAKLVKGQKGLEHSELIKTVDAIIVLGGDGTFLSTARLATESSVPLLGVNLGSLGFITEVSLDQMEKALNSLFEGSYCTENRIMLDVKVENDKNSHSGVALNDAVLSGKNKARMTELTITVNGLHVMRYKADGLIIATPTGSTAYALSAAGPILHPTLDALVICPICPHTLSNRPLVVSGDSIIEVDIQNGQRDVVATLDGQMVLDVDEYDHITIFRSKKVTQILKVPGRTHFDTLREKLGWGGAVGFHD